MSHLAFKALSTGFAVLHQQRLLLTTIIALVSKNYVAPPQET